MDCRVDLAYSDDHGAGQNDQRADDTPVVDVFTQNGRVQDEDEHHLQVAHDGCNANLLELKADREEHLAAKREDSSCDDGSPKHERRRDVEGLSRRRLAGIKQETAWT
ncbi:unnamed protein product [Phytophthora fragariaefolia]|uniref:Unnamed protein product n=1 Tax=Phytophthora fragariaefolia TaxID=1490495 RepID=A0A9W6XYY1_9STRA|nr:unnamed protein product [Phytophthora fragariaefolia]